MLLKGEAHTKNVHLSQELVNPWPLYVSLNGIIKHILFAESCSEVVQRASNNLNPT